MIAVCVFMTDRHFCCLPTGCLPLAKEVRLNDVTFKKAYSRKPSTYNAAFTPANFTLSHKQEMIPNTLMDYFVHVVAIPRQIAFHSMAVPFCPFDNRDRPVVFPSCCSLPLDIIKNVEK